MRSLRLLLSLALTDCVYCHFSGTKGHFISTASCRSKASSGQSESTGSKWKVLIPNLDKIRGSYVNTTPPLRAPHPNHSLSFPWAQRPKWKVNQRHHLVSDLCSCSSSASLPLWAAWTVVLLLLRLLWDTPPVNPPPLGWPFQENDMTAVAEMRWFPPLLASPPPLFCSDSKGESHGLTSLLLSKSCNIMSICAFQNTKDSVNAWNEWNNN